MFLEIKENKLILPNAQIEFKYRIADNIIIPGCVVVMMGVPLNTDEVDNIQAISLNDGKLLWKVQSVKEYSPDVEETSPYVGMKLLKNGNISATNWFGMNYEISAKNGKILSSHLAK